MGRTRTFTALTFTLGLFLAMVSCQNELLPVPTGIKEQTSREAAPEHFVASHGRQKIHLSWSPVAGAQGYRIYASDLMTPTEESFAQVTYVIQSETPVAEIDVKPGSEAWYRVSAILSNGAETVASKSLRATSLATPEITDIQTDSDDATVLTVYWNMSNCRDDTYRKQTEYTITCISPSDTISRTVKATQLQETCFTVDGLMAHTSYSCKITARTEFGDESESSEISAETLHQLQPQAPVALEASLGDDKNGITLSFKLPEKADLQRKDDGTFEKAPIKFTVYRKALGDESWVKVSENPELKKSDGSALTASEYPDDGGLEVSWKDTDVPQRGVIYEYKVQSFVDLAAFKGTSLTDEQLKKSYNYIETSTTVSSSTTSGWRMAAPSLSTNSASYSTIPSPENPAVYTEAVLEEGGLIFSWNNFLLDSSVANANLAAKYKYLLYEHMKPFDCDKKSDSDVGTIKMVGAYSSSADLGKYKRQFNLSGGQSGDRGKYSYIVYIVPESYPTPSIGSSPDSSLLGDDKSGCAETPTSIAVTDNAGSIEGFTVKGGFSNKFIISWNNQSGTKYSLTYTEMVDGVITASDKKVFSDKEYNGSTVTESDTFTPESKKGVSRRYILTAEPSLGSAPISQTSEECFSLGTPDPQFDNFNPYYDSITVSWEKVQAAKSYTVKLEEEAPVDIITEGENANTHTSRDQLGNLVYSYTFTPDQLGTRYTDASRAGTRNKVTISATSEENDTTSGEVEDTKVLGPAEIGLTTTVAQYYKSISVTWKKIDGANAYQILRKRYAPNGSGGWKTDEDEWETFVVDVQSGTVKSNGEPYSAMTLTLDGGKYTLKDSHVDIPAADKGSAGQIAITQSRIPWGIPIEYMVIPMRSTGDSFNGTTISSDSIKVDGKKFQYTGISSFAKKGSAVGYGLDVHAAKAESSENIKISWTKPYTEGVIVNPLIYRRLKGSTSEYGQAQILAQGLSPSATTLPQICTTDSERTKAFEYAVKYIASGATDSSGTAEQNKPFVESYTDFLSEKKDTNGEPLAVGYLFYLPQFIVNNVLNSDGSEGFMESVNWTYWNYGERKNGPEDIGDTPAYTIWMKNKNNSSGWFQIASAKTDETLSITQDPGWYEANITKSATGVILSPNNVSDTSGTNNGLLKVQRDYKHYYMIRGQRVNSEGKTIYTYIGLDGNTWTYRRISAEEFAKNVLLIVADAVNQCGIAEGDRTTEGYNGNGIFKTNRYTMNTGFMYGTENTSYIHTFHGTPGTSEETDFPSDYTLKFPMTERLYGVIMYSPYYFPVSNIQATHASRLKSYQGQMTFTAGEKLGMWDTSASKVYSLSADVTLSDGTKKTVTVSNNQSQFESTFPISLGTDLHDRVSKKSDKSERLQFNGIWWTVRTGGQESSSFTEAE